MHEHRRMAYQYNEEWKQFLFSGDQLTEESIRNFAKKLSIQYNFIY